MMKKTNTAGKKFRFNFIDALLILIILAAAALLGFIFTSGNLNMFGSTKTVQIEYVVQARNIRDEFKGVDGETENKFIRSGDRVTDTVTLYSIGEVVNVEYTDGVYVGVNRDENQVVNSLYPGHSNANITIRATAEVSERGYDVNGYKVAVGKLIAMRVPNFTCEGYCISISEVSING